MTHCIALLAKTQCFVQFKLWPENKALLPCFINKVLKLKIAGKYLITRQSTAILNLLIKSYHDLMSNENSCNISDSY